jgi:hypothetical protein
MREAYSTQLAMVAGVLMLLVTLLFALVQSPELTTAQARRAPALPHPLQGFHACHLCHGIGESNPYPIRHLGWHETLCLRCHAS